MSNHLSKLFRKPGCCLLFSWVFLSLIAVNYTSARAQAPRVVVVNAANFSNYVSADSIAVAFGVGLTTVTASSASLPLPTQLGGVRVEIGSAVAGLFFVSPEQVNFYVPAHLGTGLHQVRISNSAGTLFLGEVFISDRAPGVFTVYGNGQGAAVGYTVPAGDITYLVFFGTGFRGGGVGDTWLHIAGLGSFAAQYVGQAPGFVGLHQVNVPVPSGAIRREIGAVFTSGLFQSQGFTIRP